MDFLANYYVKSNFLPIANCIGNRIGEGENYTCDNSVAKNFLDTAAEEPYNLFQTVEQHKNDIIDNAADIHFNKTRLLGLLYAQGYSDKEIIK